MRRKTPRTPNPYREVYKKYAELQMTLEEILATFSNYTIYGTLDNTEIHIVDVNNKEYLFMETLGYDDDDCVSTIYETSPMFLATDFNEVSSFYIEDGFAVTQLN